MQRTKIYPAGFLRTCNLFGVAVIFTLAILGGCSTEKNKFINRTYHNTTAKYNGFFNAREIIKEALIDFHVQYKDDYTKILPVFIIPDESSSKSLFPAMEKAIEKTSVVIKKHSMPSPDVQKNKKDEWCKWIDDNWLVMGQAYYYKRELTDAKVRFDHVAKYYGTLPIKYEGQLWLARTLMETNDMSGALRFLEKLQDKLDEDAEKSKKKKNKKTSRRSHNSSFNTTAAEPDFPVYIADELAMTWADYYLRKKEYTSAIDYLKKAIELTRTKSVKARLCFILAQLYQLRGDNSQATQYYQQVDKLNPEYEMEFYSRIFRALISEGDDNGTLKKLLVKMAKDEKNKDYLDQIYYALADIELKSGNRQVGMEDLNLSVRYSTTNNRQKGISYMRMGDIFYSDKNFIRSKAYYDSTILNLPTDYENYEKVKNRADGLKELVENLLIIQYEDSLQRIAGMPSGLMEKYLDDVIKKRKEEEERKKQAELNKQNQTAQNNSQTNGGNNNWYWWNPQAVAQGFQAFKKTWGTRKPEDDWRRSDKTSTLDITNPENNDTMPPLLANDPLAEREKLMKTLPLTPEKIKASNEKLANALFKAGVIYKERLGETALGAATLKRFVKDFSEHEQALPAYYLLYRIYADTDAAQAREYENIILTRYPDSDYANIIRNPNYLREQAELMKEDERVYEKLFYQYKQKNFKTVIDECNAFIQSGKKSPMIPRFYFLGAIACGQIGLYEDMENFLAGFIEKHPADHMVKEAKELLELVRNRNTIEEVRAGKSTYLYEPNEEHFFVLYYPNSMGPVNDAKNLISNFNQESFPSSGLKINNNFIDLNNQLIIVKPFSDKEKAMSYYIAFKNNTNLSALTATNSFFVISAKNYSTFYLEKKLDNYMKFFMENYQ